MQTNTQATLDRANRHRWRARCLEIRAAAVMRGGDQPRALRIQERVARAHYQADRTLLGGMPLLIPAAA